MLVMVMAMGMTIQEHHYSYCVPEMVFPKVKHPQ